MGNLKGGNQLKKYIFVKIVLYLSKPDKRFHLFNSDLAFRFVITKYIYLLGWFKFRDLGNMYLAPFNLLCKNNIGQIVLMSDA